MALRIALPWWPLLAAASPAWLPWLALRQVRFRRMQSEAREHNRRLLAQAAPLELPELEFLEITPVVEEAVEPGFSGSPGVCYWLRSDRGALLLDLGFGPTQPALARNAGRLGLSWSKVDALAISHLHPDHMGGIPALRSGRVTPAPELGDPRGLPCFLPAPAQAPGFEPQLVQAPRLLAAGLASSGPLARALFFLGMCHEQVVLARLRDRGVVVITGCGHPGMELILEMAGRLSPGPIFALAGGLHLPLSRGRGSYAGIQMQTLLGTGKPPWRRIGREDLERSARAVNAAGVQRVLLSAHDTCDQGLALLQQRLTARSQVLRAGATYRL